MNKRPVIIDCDPGVDDALAIILAAKKESLDIKAITTVSGNVELKYTTKNARILSKILNLDVIIGKGAERPMIEDIVTSKNTHGKDGLGGIGNKFKEENLPNISNLPAVEVMAKIIKESKEKVSIIATGPLTNVAIFLLAYPELKPKIEVISIMGGSITLGNKTAKGEFNFVLDPLSAYIVMNSNVKKIMSGLNVTLKAFVTDEDLKEISKINNNISKLAYDILNVYKGRDKALHDPVAVIAITNPELLKYKAMNINVETSGEELKGVSFADERNYIENENNCLVVTDINREKFIDEIIKSLK